MLALFAALAALLGAVRTALTAAPAAGGARGGVGSRSSSSDAGPAPLPGNPGCLLPILETDPVRVARRFAAIVVLLEALRETLEPLRAGDGDAYRGGGVLLFAHSPGCLFNRSGRGCSCPVAGARECERLLAVMPERLAWHVRMFFVDVERRGRWEHVQETRRRRRVRSRLRYRRVFVRHPQADKGLALEGVDWMAHVWQLRDLRGELVEPWLVSPSLDIAA